MSIRKRTPEDLPAISRLLEAVHLPATGLERTEGWVCELDGQVVGHVALEATPDAAVIRSLVVAAARQGQGLGAQLLDAAEVAAGGRTRVLKTDSIGPWVQRRDYQAAALAEVPASVLTTTQFEGSLCSGYPVFMRTPGAVDDPAVSKTPVPHAAGRIEVFDPAMCCATGVCGPSVDPKLVRFSADLDWLKAQGVAVERCNLAQQPMAFAQDPAVRAALEAQGEAALPLIKVDGRVKSLGSYPLRAQLADWAGVAGPVPSLAERDLAPSPAAGHFRATGSKRLAGKSAKSCCAGADAASSCC